MEPFISLLKPIIFVAILFMLIYAVSQIINHFNKKKYNKIMQKFEEEKRQENLEINNTRDESKKYNEEKKPINTQKTPNEILGIDGRAYLLINYIDTYGATTQRTISPVFYEGNMVQAVCYLRHDLRTFRLDRIESAFDIRQEKSLTQQELMILCAIYADPPPDGGRLRRNHPLAIITSHTDDADLIADCILDLAVYFSRLDGRLMPREAACIYDSLNVNFSENGIPTHFLYKEDLLSRNTKSKEFIQLVDKIKDLSAVDRQEIFNLLCLLFLSSHKPSSHALTLLLEFGKIASLSVSENLITRLSSKIVHGA